MKEHYPTSDPHEAIRNHVETAQDWEWRNIALILYLWTDRFNDRFFERQMPGALLSFESMDVRILAAYTLKRNHQGLLYEITFNTNHLKRPMWETLETLMHEYVHLWQQNLGEYPVEYNYHNREFVAKCEEFGLHPAIGSGAHLRPADSTFAEFLKAYGVPEPDATHSVILDSKGRPMDWWYLSGGQERRGKSTLTKWSCGCQNVRVGSKEFYASCTHCGNVFARIELSPRVVVSQGRLPETPQGEVPATLEPRIVNPKV